MFAMANAVQMVKGDVATLESKLYEVTTGLKVTLPYEVQENSVRINGFTEAAEAAAGKFNVVITTTGDNAPNTVITFSCEIECDAIGHHERIVHLLKLHEIIGTQSFSGICPFPIQILTIEECSLFCSVLSGKEASVIQFVHECQRLRSIFGEEGVVGGYLSCLFSQMVGTKEILLVDDDTIDKHDTLRSRSHTLHTL